MPGFRSYRRFFVGALVAAIALPCFADEFAILKNGFSIRYARKEVVGEVTRLYVNKDGSNFVDVATAQLDHFEAAPDLPASLAAASSSHKPELTPGLNLAPLKSSTAPGANVATGFAARPKANISDLVNEASGR